MGRFVNDAVGYYLAKDFIENRLKPPLLHGDEQHQQWLTAQLEDWIPDLAEIFKDCRAGIYGYRNDSREE